MEAGSLGKREKIEPGILDELGLGKQLSLPERTLPILACRDFRSL